MWIVRLALGRPYTFVVMAIMGGLSIVTTPTDIFPYINIPMVGVIWNYTGMSPDDMARRVLFVSERAMTTSNRSLTDVASHHGARDFSAADCADRCLGETGL
jgi:multidrug efflux pump subunit AcrB